MTKEIYTLKNKNKMVKYFNKETNMKINQNKII
jgi:hypothetical protein